MAEGEALRVPHRVEVPMAAEVVAVAAKAAGVAVRESVAGAAVAN